MSVRVGGIVWIVCVIASAARAEQPNLINNPGFEQRAPGGGSPAGFALDGDVEYRYLGDPSRDAASWGVALQSARDLNRDGELSGSVAQTVAVNLAAGRAFRFTCRGLPQDHFEVGEDDLYLKVEFLGPGPDGRVTSFDAKAKPIYPLVEQARRDLTANGVRHEGGAAVWRTYRLDFYVPFPQVDRLRVSIGFGHGVGRAAAAGTEFLVDDFSLTHLDAPADGPASRPALAERVPLGTPVALGGRWFYDPKPGETQAPRLFDHKNADRLLYHDARWSAPFDGNMTATLHVGQKDLAGRTAAAERPVLDNVTLRFDASSLVIHTHGLPNHPTGRFPEDNSGRPGNPNYIQEKDSTYYIPLNPTENPRHVPTTTDNGNHALPMGPIGVAVNGVVFFNPFDAGSQDATDMMDRCCGHPAPDYTYHYHKYPICLNSPWQDEGAEHSALIGFAFDGYPVYGPYESANVMAKDVAGERALNAFNMHYDEARGWHYHVTPGKFPYLIGGYWGTMDARDASRGPRGGGGGGRGPGGGPGGGGPPRGGPGGGGPPGGGPPGGGPGPGDGPPPGSGPPPGR